MSASSQSFRHNTPLLPSKPESRFKFFYPVLLLVMFSGVLLYLSSYLRDAIRFPVERVEVGGKLVYTDKQQLMRIIKAHTRKGFFGLSIEEVRIEVASLPWVKESYVRRVLPNRLHVDVVERRPALQWNDDGLIDSDGEVFYPPQLLVNGDSKNAWQKRFATLPHLRGVDERSEFLQNTLGQYQLILSTTVPTLLGLFEDDRRSQTLFFDNNIVVRLGYEQQEDRLTRFKNLYSRYVNGESGINVQFDMRYTNGFAVAELNSKHNSDTGYN